MKTKMSIVQKICLSGIMIVLVALFQKIFAINYIAVVPFLRLSFGGPALIIFSSILLGPWFGMLIGAASDLLGFLIFDPKTMSPYPMFQITFIYAMLGFVSYFVYRAVTLIQSKKVMIGVEGGFFGLVWLVLSLVVLTQDGLVMYNKVFNITTPMKIVVPIISFILLSAMFLFTVLIDKKLVKHNSNTNVYQISFMSFIVEMLVMVLFGSAMKTWGFMIYYPTPFYSILYVQLLVAVFNVPFNTILISYMKILTDQIIKK